MIGLEERLSTPVGQAGVQFCSDRKLGKLRGVGVTFCEIVRLEIGYLNGVLLFQR